MQNTQRLSSTCCTLEGNLFLPFQLQQVFLGKNILQQPSAYKIPKGTTLKEECSRSFNIARAEWSDFQKIRTQTALPEERRLEFTRHFVKQLFNFGLGYTLTEVEPIFVPYLQDEASPEDRIFPVTLLANNIPVAIVSDEHPLDELYPLVTYTNGDTRKKTAFQIIQELINGKPEYTWGFVCNGLTLRLVHKAISLTRPCYVEFNLETILNGGDYAEFFHMWELLHASRTMCNKVGLNVWDQWVQEGIESGQPAREALGKNLEQALQILGTGFLKTPGNEELLAKLESHALSATEYQHQLLQLVYRFLFVFTLEERHILNTMELISANDGTNLSFKQLLGDTPNSSINPANQLARERYEEGYSFHRFIVPSRKQRFQNTYTDAWASVVLVFKALDQGEPRLALPALGGLFSKDRCSDLSSAKLSNQYFFQAMEKMRWATLNGVLTTIDYKNMGTEELGSIYEGLLELIPQVNLEDQCFSFVQALGNERKSSGSYYTPDELVQSLIKSALDPVIDQKISGNPANPEQALLSLSVIDPACGSGHFLLAAARRIAEKLAEVRAGNEVLTPELYRKSLHDVIQNCIYGVDLNPMAVELSKIALWLEGFAEGTPLSFLDHHIKVGNALLGVFDLNMIKQGIPDEAYALNDKNIEPEFSLTNKVICSLLSKQNRTERTQAIKGNDLQETLPLFASTNALEISPAFNSANERQKELLYQRYQEQLQSDPQKLACDLYIAAFICPKTEDSQLKVPTSNDVFKQLYAPETLTQESLARSKYAADICAANHVFHWPIEFPEHCKDGSGFDCVLGNPPWEKPKVEDTKWFEGKEPTIADKDKKADDRKKMIKALAQGKFGVKYLKLSSASEERQAYEKVLYRQYANDKQFFSAFSSFGHLPAKSQGRFPLTGVGDTNLYSYFSELANSLRNVQGTVGLVVPSGILTDATTQAFSREVFNGHIKSAYHFDNTEKFFPTVAVQYTFILLTLKDEPKADFVFYASNIKHLDDPKRHIYFKPTDLRLFNPNTHSCVLTRSYQDLELCRKLYGKAPILLMESDPEHGNPWHIHTLCMFHMSGKSALFHEQKDSPSLVPLYEGKMFNQFDHRWKCYDSNQFRDVSQLEKEQKDYVPNPRYWIESTEVKNRLNFCQWDKPWLMAWRDVGRSTDERSLISSVLPVVGVNDKGPLILPKVEDKLAACLLALLNSLVIDYVMRIKLPGICVAVFIIQQLPVLPPEAFKPQDVEFICQRVAMLTRTADDINAVWLTEYPSYTFQKPEERLKIQAELDAYIARMYGLTRDEVRYILDPSDVMGPEHPSVTFKKLKNIQIKEFGEYLTQRLVLQAFDDLESGALK